MISTLKYKLIRNRIRWYTQILKRNEEGMLKEVLNIKNGKHPRGKLISRQEQQVRKDVTERKDI
jgi:hypothetical protein